LFYSAGGEPEEFRVGAGTDANGKKSDLHRSLL
jgi:hypothetical protein